MYTMHMEIGRCSQCRLIYIKEPTSPSLYYNLHFAAAVNSTYFAVSVVAIEHIDALTFNKALIYADVNCANTYMTEPTLNQMMVHLHSLQVAVYSYISSSV